MFPIPVIVYEIILTDPVQKRVICLELVAMN